MRLRLIFTAIILALTAESIRAQQLQATRSHYTTADGLCSNVITVIQQDGYGYIWIGTRNGLSRYDGYHFFNYMTGNRSHVKNLHNHLLNMVIDQSQNVWMRMYDRRIFVLDRHTDQIINPFENTKGEDDFFCSTPPIVTTSGDVLVNIKGQKVYKLQLSRKGLSREVIATSDQRITALCEDSEKGIWVGTEKGLLHIGADGFYNGEAPLLPEEHIACICSAGMHINVATQDGKIYTINGNLTPKLIRKAAGRPIFAIFEDSKELVWFCDNTMGVLCINPQTGQEKRYRQVVPVPEPDERGAVFREVNGLVWVRMNYGGYGYYNRETDVVEYFHNDPSSPWNLLNTVQTSLELPEGIVWESTKRRGLEKLEIQRENIERVKPMPGSALTIDNEVRAMYYDTNRRLLLMGNKNSTLFLQYDNGQRTTITHDSEGNPFGRFYGISKDSKGNYWLCSKDNGVYHMSPNAQGSWTIRHFAHEEDNPKSLSHNSAYMVTEDKEGNIWIAIYGGGVNMLPKGDVSHPNFIHFNNGITGYPKNSHLRVRVVEADNEGRIWAGTTDGILILTTENGKVKAEQLKMPKAEDQMLMNNDIVCMKRDRKGTMWIGTNGGGLARTKAKTDDTWVFESYGSQDGLPTEEIRSITFDQRGNPWFATEYNICSLDLQTNVITSYSSLDGISETELSEAGAISLPNGNLLFGTIDGYYIVDMNKLMTGSGSLLKLQITDFFINEEIQSPRLNDTYDYYVPQSRSVKLPSNEVEFSFRFASLNYQLQHRVHYQYMLEGYDKDWQTADRNRMAVYHDVPPGTYTFKVKAFLLESPEKYDIRSMEVVVPSIFKLSLTVVTILCVLLAIICAAVIYWLVVRRKLS